MALSDDAYDVMIAVLIDEAEKANAPAATTEALEGTTSSHELQDAS